MANFTEYLARVRSEIDEISPEEVRQLLESGGALQLLDVRERHEIEQGMIPGARHLPRAHFEVLAEEVLPARDVFVVVYCAGGVRSAFAARTLKELGYVRVASMSGGFGRWRSLGFASLTPAALDSAF